MVTSIWMNWSAARAAAVPRLKAGSADAASLCGSSYAAAWKHMPFRPELRDQVDPSSEVRQIELSQHAEPVRNPAELLTESIIIERHFNLVAIG